MKTEFEGILPAPETWPTLVQTLCENGKDMLKRAPDGNYYRLTHQYRPNGTVKNVIMIGICPQEAAAWLALEQKFTPKWQKLLARIFGT